MFKKTVAKVNCSCTTGDAAAFQDKVYGKGVRVANLATKSVKSGLSTVDVGCTVCGRKHTVQESRLN